MDAITDSISRLTAQEWMRDVFWTVLLLAVTAIAARILSRALRKILQRDSNPLPNASIFINIARGLTWVLGLSVILNSCFGIDVSAILTALGVGGIAVSLGFQDTLANLIGGIQVTFMGIVKPGDNIEVGAEAGVVQDVSWRHTTIEDSLGQTVVIPNSIISKTALVHLLPATRVTVPFAVRDLGAVCDGAGIDALSEKLADAAREAASRHAAITEGPRVLYSEITEFGVKGKVIFSVDDAAATFSCADAAVRAIAGLIAGSK